MQPRNRADAYAIALGEARRRLAFGEPLPRLLDLVRSEFRLTPHPGAIGAGDLSAFVVRLMIRKRSSSAKAAHGKFTLLQSASGAQIR